MALLRADRERQDSVGAVPTYGENAPMGATAIPLDVAATKASVTALMPEAIANLKRLVGLASVAAPGFPSQPVHAMAEAVCDLFTRAGLPDAEFVLWGADDANSNVHGTNESVDPSDIELMALAQAILIESLAARG